MGEQNTVTNQERVDFPFEHWDVNRTSAKEMLLAMMSIKKEDNFKKQFSEAEKKGKKYGKTSQSGIHGANH